MKDGFIKAAAGTPDVRVADCEFNATEIIRMVHEMEEQGAKVMVFPELCITAYTCGDLFWQENLLEEAKVHRYCAFSGYKSIFIHDFLSFQCAVSQSAHQIFLKE